MEDLISRQAAIDTLMPIYKKASLRNRNVFSVAKQCMKVIEELPSAQPERKRGNWIKGTERFGRHFYGCDCCETKVEIPTFMNEPLYNFCPYCGADMRGE